MEAQQRQKLNEYELEKRRYKALFEQHTRDLKDLVKKIIELRNEEQQQHINRVNYNLEDVESNIDIQSHYVNYRADPELVGAVRTILDALKQHLKENNFDGEFTEIGSFFSNTRVFSCNEFDYLYELSTTDFCVEDGEVAGTKYIKDNQHATITPVKVYEAFKKAIDHYFYLQKPQLQSGLTFGGFAHPDFSGSRENIPAVTLLFRWKAPTTSQESLEGAATDSTENQSYYRDISVDLTVAYQLEREKAKLIVEASENLKKFSSTEEAQQGIHLTVEEIQQRIHLVPLNLEKDCWYLTTAALESYLFHQFVEKNPDCAPIELIRRCKVISRLWISKPTHSHFNHHGGCQQMEVNFVMQLLTEFEAGTGGDIKDLGRLVSIAHVLLPNTIKDRLHELTSSHCLSVNSSAMKYITLTRLDNESSLAELQEPNTKTKGVIQNLGDKIVQHTFLPFGVVVYTTQLTHVNIMNDILAVALGYCDKACDMF